MDKQTRVEIPAHAVFVKTGGNTYVQQMVRSFRKEKGKPINELNFCVPTASARAC